MGFTWGGNKMSDASEAKHAKRLQKDAEKQEAKKQAKQQKKGGK